MRRAALVAFMLAFPVLAAGPIDSLNQQVMDLYNQGRFEEATPLCIQLVQMLERQFGPDSLQFASGLNNLAELYVKQHKPDQAEPLYRRALAIREAQLGADHPDVAKSRARLAELLQAKPAPKPAAPPPPPPPRSNPEMEKALALNQQSLQLSRQGKAAEALPLAQQVLAVFQAHLPADHPNIAVALGNVAQLQMQLAHYDEALPLFQRAAAILERRHDGNPADLGFMLANIADIHAQKQNYAEAESWYKRALPVLEKALKPGDENISRILNNLAECYRAQGKVPEIDPLMKGRIKPGRVALPVAKLAPEQTKPPDPADVEQASQLDQALFHLTQAKKYEEALPVALDLQALTEKMYGASSLAAALNLDRLAELYRELGRDAEAEPLAAKSRAIREAARASDRSIIAK
jgi:tetratricopeptide (TPR) repeat protein